MPTRKKKATAAKSPAKKSPAKKTEELPPPLARTAQEIGDMLQQVGAILEILGENVFKVRAYENAARIIPGLGDELPGFVERGELSKVHGIGKGIAERVAHLARWGRLAEFEEINARVPPGLLEILRVPGLGPKKIKLLYDTMDIASLEALEEACRQGRLSSLKGFGKKTQENILSGIAQYRRVNRRFGWITAWQHAQPVYEALRQHAAVDALEVAGSLRRKRETVKDVDLLVSTRDPDAVSKFFAEGDWTERVIGSGSTKTSILLKSGLQIDLRVVTALQFPHALHHFTGSKAHNVAMRSRAQRMEFKINEYGLYHGEELVVCKDEAELYEKLGLAYVPPELREDLGEVQAAEAHTLPRALVEWDDLRGALHVHSNAASGQSSPRELIDAAEQLGWGWLGIADVTQAVDAVAGLPAAAVVPYLDDLRVLASQTKKIRLLCGISVAIDAKGKLDLPAKVLQAFDYVIAGVYDHYDLSRAAQTKRLVTALQSGLVSVLAHPLARLLGERDALQMDYSQIVATANECGVFLEINGDPQRMDLDGVHVKQARDHGARFVVEPDAGSSEELRRAGYALGMARRGWLEAAHVANTLSPDELQEQLHQPKTRKETSV